MVSPAAGSLPKGNTSSTEETLTHILYVDNEAGLLKAAKPILEMQDSFHVETASSVEEAMKKMEDKTFDVIVSDYIMPGKDGLEFLKELREGGNNIPFIIFTGKGREEVAIEALNLGADQYINKIGKTEAVYSELAHSIRTVVKSKRAAEALRESEKRFRELSELLPQVIFEMDSKGDLKFVNHAAYIQFGYSREEFDSGLNALQMLAPEDRERAEENIERVLRGEKIGSNEYTALRKDGTTFPIIINSNPIIRGDRAVGLRGIMVDITERKQIEIQLKESEEKYRKQFEAAMDAIFLGDAETGTIIDCNRAATKLVGRKKSEIIGKHQRILHPPEAIEGGFSRTFKQHLKEKEGQVLEDQIITKNGEIKDVIINATTFELEGKRLIQGIFHDITERKKTDEKLKESERKYRLLTENTTDVIYIQDMNLSVTYVSPSVEKLSGYTPEELLKLRPENFMTPESFERGLVDFKEAITLAAEEPDYEIPLKQYEYVRKDGSTFWGELKMKMLRDSNNNLVGVQGTLRDVTERKEAEKKLDEMMNEVVTINEKLGVVGRLTRHDARNKLSVIANNVYLAKQKLPANHNSLIYLGDVESAVDQMEEIFDFARNYEMLGVEELSYMDVGKSVEEVVILL